MSKWFYINVIVFLFAAGNFFMNPLLFSLKLPMLFGLIGLLFLMFNWTRHAVFSTIRNVPERKTKIKFANVSKKVLPFHRWTGSLALLLIIIHAALIIDRYGGVSFQHIKMVSGLLAGLVLLFMVTSGWIRFFHPTVNMRKIHLGLGFTLFFFVVIHLLL